MGNSHSADVKVISNSGQSSIIAVLVNEALDVEQSWEVVPDHEVKQFPSVGQVLIHHNFEEVCKVIATMEANPSQFLIQNKARLSQFFGEVDRANAVFLKQLKVDSRPLQQVDGVHSVPVLVDVKVKVKLPGGDRLGHNTVLVCQGDTDLDDLEYVSVLSDAEVLAVLLIFR